MSFFAVSPHKFESVALEADATPTKPFLDCCTEIVLFFDVLGSTAFAPVKSDIHGNIKVARLTIVVCDVISANALAETPNQVRREPSRLLHPPKNGSI